MLSTHDLSADPLDFFDPESKETKKAPHTALFHPGVNWEIELAQRAIRAAQVKAGQRQLLDVEDTARPRFQMADPLSWQKAVLPHASPDSDACKKLQEEHADILSLFGACVICCDMECVVGVQPSNPALCNISRELKIFRPSPFLFGLQGTL